MRNLKAFVILPSYIQAKAISFGPRKKRLLIFVKTKRKVILASGVEAKDNFQQFSTILKDIMRWKQKLDSLLTRLNTYLYTLFSRMKCLTFILYSKGELSIIFWSNSVSLFSPRMVFFTVFVKVARYFSLQKLASIRGETDCD